MPGNFRHGMAYTPEYKSFKDAKGRCVNPKHRKYPNYGGRGIQFRLPCFVDFYSHLGPRPSAKHSLDRMNNEGHYELGNIRWATMREQANNRRQRRPLSGSGSV
jgi:hypothetical protein